MNGSKDSSKAPAGRSLTTGVVYLGLFLFAYTVPLPNAAMNGIAASLGLPKVEDTAPVLTSYFLAWLIVIPPIAFLADRFGRKPILLVGSLILTAGMVLFSYAESLEVACFAQLLNGGGAIILQIVGVAILTDMYAEKRASALNLAIGLVGILALLSPLLMGELQERGVEWRMVYRFSAVLPLTAFLIQLLSRFPAAGQTVPITGKAVAELLSRPIFLLLIVSMLVYGIVEQGVPIWSPNYLGEDFEATPRQKGLVVAGYFVVMSLVRLIVGWFRLFEEVPHPRMIIISSALGAGCIVAGSLMNDAILATVFLAASGGAIALIWPSIMTFAVQATGAPTTTVFGLVVGIGGSIGVMLGSGALALVKSQAGLTFQQSLLTLVVPLVLLLIVFIGVAVANRFPAQAGRNDPPVPAQGESGL